jgi:hypothetical protein
MTNPVTPENRGAMAEAIYAWEERAAIIEHDGRMTKAQAEMAATAAHGFRPPAYGSVLRMIDAGGRG